MNMKKISKFGVCLIGALTIGGFAQDYSGKGLNTSFRDKRIDGYDFSDAKAKKGVTDFQRSAGEKPSFQGAKLEGVSFQNAVISEANFKEADLRKVTISGADIRNSNFKGANMEEANLYRATLLDSQFPKTNLKNARLDMMKVSEETDFSKSDMTMASPHQRELRQSGSFPGQLQRCRIPEREPAGS